MNKNFIKINKRKAEKLHKNGESVYVLPSNLLSWNMYMPPMEIGEKEDFQAFINAYAFYNCNAETGRRVSFYIDESSAKNAIQATKQPAREKYHG